MSRHYCSYCGKRRYAKNLVQVYYPLLKQSGFHCPEHLSRIRDNYHIINHDQEKQSIELFCGKSEVSNALRSAGYKIYRSDINPDVTPDLCSDILKARVNQFPRPVEFLWASLPCQTYSIMAVEKHWKKVEYGWRRYYYYPQSSVAKEAVKILAKTIYLIHKLNPTYYLLENPRGALRHMPHMALIPFRHTVSYADYGMDYYKPTDLFTNIPDLQLKRIKYMTDYDLKRTIQDIPDYYQRSAVPKLLIESIIEQIPTSYL